MTGICASAGAARAAETNTRTNRGRVVTGPSSGIYPESVARSYTAAVERRLVEELLPVADVIGKEKLGEVVRRGVVGPAAVDAGQLLDELDEVGIRRDHEGGDRDAVAAAGVGLLERAVDDLQVQA